MKLHFAVIATSQAKLVNFNFPDPVKDINTHFCPVDEFIDTHLTVKCSNSMYEGSTCRFSCPVGLTMMGPGDGSDRCKCDGDNGLCEWRGTTRFADCYNEAHLFNETKILEHQMKLFPEVFLKSAVNEMSPDFEVNDDLNSWIDDYDGMSYDDLQSKYKNNRHFSHLAKSERDDARRDYHTKLRSRYRQAQKLLAERDQEVDQEPVLLEQRGLFIGGPDNFEPTDEACKPLTLTNGKVTCTLNKKPLQGDDMFQKGVECKNTCNPGWRLRGNSPQVKKCICRKGLTCKWIRNLKAKCARAPGIGNAVRNEEETEAAAPAPVLKPCIAIENGKKKLTRNQQCVCPSGWHLSDKCFTPITDKTAPCSFVDNFESQGVATLNCANVKQQGYHNTEEFVVPGITTDLDFSNSRIFNFQVAKIDGAYRLQVLKLNDNMLMEIPRNFFENNHIMKKLTLANNQIRTLRPEVFQTMRQLEELDLSGNMLRSFNKRLLKNAQKLKVLNLSNNQLGPSLQKWAFHRLPAMLDLDLSHNLIKSVMGLTFAKSKKLQRLDMSNNKIGKLKAQLFNKAQQSFKELNLANNDVSFITKQFTQAIPHMENLNMENNQLKGLKKETFFPTRKLIKLNLNGNRLADLPETLFNPAACKLKAVFMKENQMKFLNQKVFANCTDLRHLFVSENQITKVPSKLLDNKPELKTVDLSRNAIKFIPTGFTKGASKLQNVYLNDNEIELLPADILTHNPRLEVLDLENNKLQNSTDTFNHLLSVEKEGRNIGSLQVINLKNNDDLGRLSDLYHSQGSWYTMNGNFDTAVADPLEQLKNRVSQAVAPGRQADVFDIMQRKIQIVDDLEL